MKLKNKKTGEIGNLLPYGGEDGRIWVWIDNMSRPEYRYHSLAELNEEWEDYEEPKVYWYMSNRGDIRFIDDEDTDWDNERKQIGNYFETKEEAERAVEKLKAWKRLIEAKFRFTDCGYNLDEISSSLISADGKVCFELMCYEDFEEDLDLLFGDEE